MASRSSNVLRILVASTVLNAATGNPAIARNVGVPHRMPFAFGIYDPWFVCIPPYGCQDSLQLRLELERDRRLQELRERAARSEPRLQGPAEGPWGGQRYLPPATPEANIQPAYRGASQLRPEYEQSTKAKPQSPK